MTLATPVEVTSSLLRMTQHDLGILSDIANTEINKLYMWFCANKFSLNAKKTQ